MTRTKKQQFFEYSDLVDNMGMVYISVLFVSGIIWSFIAINNFETPTIFKLSLIYSLLLIFGFLGISYDRRENQLGLDSRIWEGTKLKFQLLLSIILFAIWYLVFMSSGFSVASAQSVTGGALFSVSPGLNFFLTAVLGPIAENIFFFGVINITLIFILNKLFSQDSKSRSIVLGIIILAMIPLFDNVPNATLILFLASGITILTGLSRIPILIKHSPLIISALIVGGIVFPKFHSFAYQLNQSSYIAAQVFGIGACIIVGYVGLLPVDILHIANNAAVAIGIG